MADGDPYRTKSGRVLTEQELDALAEEAERGYDVSRLNPFFKGVDGEEFWPRPKQRKEGEKRGDQAD